MRVSWIERVSVGLVAIVITVTLPLEGRADSSDDFVALLDAEMPDLLERYGVSGTVVAHIAEGDVAWTKAFGLADSAQGTPMRPDMVFQFGSCGKVLTAWATMRLVEEGTVDLDAPVNRYLRRFRIDSSAYDADEVTVRRLLTHTSGLNMHGYLDYSPRRVDPPGLVQSLEGVRLIEGLTETVMHEGFSLGNVEVVQQPGQGFRYSGAGYALLQMLIEDVTGEPFNVFVQNEVTDPLEASSLRWEWTPELEGRAPTPYAEEGQPVEYRQLTMHAIGSEIGTVTDFARFVAAAVAGPNGEPPGRGVLRPETVSLMTRPSFEAPDQGLGYGVGRVNGSRALMHGGANTGWMAFFILDITRRGGLVVASASNRAEPLHNSIIGLWEEATYGHEAQTQWPPAPVFGPLSTLLIGIAALVALVLTVGLVRFYRDLKAGRRSRARPRWRSSLRMLPWVAVGLFLWYTIYWSLPLYLPSWYPDLWPTKGSLILLLVITAGLLFSLVRVFFPKTRATRQARAPGGA